MTKVKHHLSLLPTWSTELAADIAVSESIELGPEHIEILHISRAFYDEYGFSPSMRPLCKSIAVVLGSEKARSLYLNQLFQSLYLRASRRYAEYTNSKTF